MQKRGTPKHTLPPAFAMRERERGAGQGGREAGQPVQLRGREWGWAGVGGRGRAWACGRGRAWGWACVGVRGDGRARGWAWAWAGVGAHMLMWLTRVCLLCDCVSGCACTCSCVCHTAPVLLPWPACRAETGPVFAVGRRRPGGRRESACAGGPSRSPADSLEVRAVSQPHSWQVCARAAGARGRGKRQITSEGERQRREHAARLPSTARAAWLQAASVCCLPPNPYRKQLPDASIPCLPRNSCPSQMPLQEGGPSLSTMGGFY